MMVLRRRVVFGLMAAITVLLVLLGYVEPASAHANLVRSDPPANAVLDAPPAQIRLWFSEAPEPGFSQVQLFDRSGQQIQGLGTLRADAADPKQIVTALPALQPGIYTVVWHVLSAVDGHLTAGGFAFVIGRDQVPAGGLKNALTQTITTSNSPTAPVVAVRWLTYLAMALLTGGFAFVPLIFQPALASLAAQRNKSLSGSGGVPSGSFSQDSGLFKVLYVGWALLLIANVAGALLQAASVGGDLLSFLVTTRYAALFWLRIALLILIAGLLAFRQSPWWRRTMAARWWQVGVLLGSLMLLATSLGSHAAATTEPLVPVLADWLHMLAMSIWLGGLAALLLALLWLRRTEGDSGRTVAALISRFSQVATVCVVGLGVTGALQVFFEVGDLANLIDTQYGVALLAKLALIVPLLGLGAINLLWIRRHMQQAVRSADQDSAMQPWSRLIRRTVGGEIIFVAAVLMVTGILTNLPPGREAFGAGLVARTQAEDLRIIVAANPGLPGLNTFDIYLKDQLNRPIPPVQKVALIFTMLQHDMGQNEVVAEDAGDGRYVAQGGYMSMLGTWRIEVLVRRDGQDDVRVPVTMVLNSARIGSSSPILVSPSRALLGLEIIVLGALLFVGSRRLARARRWAGWTALIGGFAVVAIGLGVAVSGFSSGLNALVVVPNPIPADAASLARGQQVYQSNCMACHGPTGAGDGPAGKNLNPPPANFQIHMAAGHLDGELFDWITNGIEGTAMPAFGTRLTDNERWDVINYIKTFANPIPPPP